VRISLYLHSMMIRPYHRADRDGCIDIFKSNTPQFFDVTELAGLENWLTGKDEGRHSYKSNSDERFFVAEAGDRLVACGGYYIPSAEKRANMVWGMVHRDHHKQGTGRELLLYRMKQIQGSYPGFAITLDTTQHTYGFFQKLGFITTRVQNDFYGKGLDRYDMILKS
jgi:ribosomal-protein-alanine N-acetyltransferase